MRRFISGLLLIMMSMSIFAEGSGAEIQKEVSGINKSTTTEGRILLEGQEKDPTLQAVDLNLVNNQEQKLETANIDYNQTEQTDDLLAYPGRFRDPRCLCRYSDSCYQVFCKPQAYSRATCLLNLY